MSNKPVKTVEEKFKKLDEISHVLLRPGRYIGSINPHTAITWTVGAKSDSSEISMVQSEITWCPALLKIFDEIISNSVDFSKTAEGKHVTTVKAEINKETGELSVYDDGGIVVKKHSEYDQYVPEMIFELRSGSNFDDEDDSVLTGQNGEGAALTSIFSKSFNVETCDGKKKFVQTHLENSRKKTEPKVTDGSKHYTKITFTPDYEKFGLTGLDGGNYQRLIKRVYDVAGCNPNLKVYLNGERIHVKSFEDYIKLYVDDFVFEENDHWKVGVAHSDDGFRHVSFVNGTETLVGGNHINYVSDQLTERLREHFKKKHKVDVKPSDIRQHLLLFIDATIVRPRYSSQTKEDLITEKKDFGTSFEVTDKMVNKLIKSPVIQSVLDWVTAKEQAALAAEQRKKNKELDKTNLRKITKFTDATEKEKRNECMLFVCEGESASNAILSARTPLIGCYPLKGKPINAMGTDIKKLMENREFVDLLAITGLKIGQKVKDISELRFGKIVSCTDADADGQHIFGLLSALIKKFWPELLEMGVFHKFITPIMKVQIGKTEKLFYSLPEFQKWAEENKDKKFNVRYLKGLGSSTSKDFESYFNNMDKHLVKIVVNDSSDLDIIDLVFGKESGSADKRKEWLQLEDK
jgi:DNA topoisomerase-2